jgi:hypothetical protein
MDLMTEKAIPGSVIAASSPYIGPNRKVVCQLLLGQLYVGVGGRVFVCAYRKQEVNTLGNFYSGWWYEQHFIGTPTGQVNFLTFPVVVLSPPVLELSALALGWPFWTSGTLAAAAKASRVAVTKMESLENIMLDWRKGFYCTSRLVGLLMGIFRKKPV